MKHVIVSLKEDLGWCEVCEEWHFFADVENDLVPEHELEYIKGGEVWCKPCDEYHKIEEIEGFTLVDFGEGNNTIYDLPDSDDLYGDDPEYVYPLDDILDAIS